MSLSPIGSPRAGNINQFNPAANRREVDEQEDSSSDDGTPETIFTHAEGVVHSIREGLDGAIETSQKMIEELHRAEKVSHKNIDLSRQLAEASQKALETLHNVREGMQGVS